MVGIAKIAPNVLIGRRTHPGPDSGYLLEGGADGRRSATQPLKAGESYKVPSAAVRDAKAAKAAPAKRRHSCLRYVRRAFNVAPTVWRNVDDQLTQNRFTYPSTN